MIRFLRQLALAALTWCPALVCAEPPIAAPTLLSCPVDQKTSLETQEQWARHLRVGRIVKNSVGIQLMLIPPGNFRMGSPDSDPENGPDELPHPVRLTRPFFISQREVTQKQFVAVMGRNPSWFSARGGGAEKVKGLDTALFPVDSASWFDAIEFCNRLSAREKFPSYYQINDIKRDESASIVSGSVTPVGGNGYRLPTEAEWEYACRAGTATPYYQGTSIDREQANTCRVSSKGFAEYDLGRTTKVGSYPPNGWGLFDMEGNVDEWCWDWYAGYVPGLGIDTTGPRLGTYRVLRGGSWMLARRVARCAARVSSLPSAGNGGIRLVRNP